MTRCSTLSSPPGREWSAESEIGRAGDSDTIETSRPPASAGHLLAGRSRAEGPTVLLPTATALQPASTAPPSAPPTATPTATQAPPTATPLPTATPAPARPVANDGANLRGGPGTDFPVVRGAAAGQALTVAGRSAGGDWLQLADGSSIATFLVAGAGQSGRRRSAPAAGHAHGQRTRVAVVEPPVQAPPPPTVEPPSSDCDPSYPTLCSSARHRRPGLRRHRHAALPVGIRPAPL